MLGSSPRLSGHAASERASRTFEARSVTDESKSMLNLNGIALGLTRASISVDFDLHRFGASLILEVTGCFVLLLLSSPFLPSARLLPAPSRKRRRRPIRRANRAAASAGCRTASAAKLQQTDGLLNRSRTADYSPDAPRCGALLFSAQSTNVTVSATLAREVR